MVDAEQLIDMYLETDQEDLDDDGMPTKHKSLAQKQGARKAGRTKMRRQYTEKNGWLHYYYYDRKENNP